jgi:DNA-binding response OmpR family regulator
MIDHFPGGRGRPPPGIAATTAVDPQVLVIEDEVDVAALLREQLGELPAQVCLARDGEQGLELALSATWDLVVLDVRLPRLSGLDVCREMRASGRVMPILILTARAGELDRVQGLELGADDYVSKPFSVLELRARARALLRRAATYQSTPLIAATAPGSILQFGALRLDRVRRVATLAGRDLALAPREWELLCFFADHPNQAFSRSELLDRVWGYGHDGYNHTVNSHINRLRAKLGDDRSMPRYIHTVWGTGYRFEPAEAP